ncbi:MAG: T9SS type A sorting domain-containing protein [Flavobacteriaceae bacterium]|nr:T9SS type A sorting domain-containing protein [Flavobacteriaceae bacterium]
MKKITLFFILFLSAIISFSQTYSTGLMTFNGSYTGQVDVTASTVTLTLNGPDDRWLGIGFGVTCMTNNNDDVVMFDGTDLTDRNYVGIGNLPATDGLSNQDWAITSNTTNGGTRTLIATRDRDTGDSNDFVFPLAEGGINFVWAYRASPGFTLSSHGGNRGSLAAGFTLGLDDFIVTLDFNISPNPVKNSFDIELPQSVYHANIDIFDVYGKKIYKGIVSNLNSNLDVTSWNNGIYLVRITSNIGTQTKRLIKQ